jgi:Raf kinase inhibitor-like YbhB/YbcL family protein
MTAAANFTLSSPAFQEGQAIPQKHSCAGEDVSPPLGWEGAPAGTTAFALIVDDPDARGFVHWVVANISGTATELPEGASGPEAGVQGTNSFRRTGYSGPCPPSGTHRYVFRLLALSQQLQVSGSPTADEVRRAAAPLTLGEATLTGTYTRAR